MNQSLTQTLIELRKIEEAIHREQPGRMPRRLHGNLEAMANYERLRKAWRAKYQAAIKATASIEARIDALNGK